MVGTQYSRKFYYQTPVNVFNGTGPTTLTSQSISAAVPVAAKTCDVIVADTGSTNTSLVWGVAGDSTGTGLRVAIVGNTVLTSTIAVGPFSFSWGASFTDVPIITSQVIYLQETQARVNDDAYISAFTF